MSHIAVIGIGAMGGGMARCLLESAASKTVTGYDRTESLVEAFYRETLAAGKQGGSAKPESLNDAVSADTDFVLLVLLNERQCDEVCFGCNPDGNSSSSSSSSSDSKNDSDHSNNSLLHLLPPKCCVILCATVTAAWAVTAGAKFAARQIRFIDCPTSGGPTRARRGDLTLMVSCHDDMNDDHCVSEEETTTLARAMPVLEALGRTKDGIHVISGGVGMASTVKMVHQLLAGVHICAAAEALALAAAAGLDVRQVYEIVNGAAGASWMFQDRGPRMISRNNEDDDDDENDPAAQVKSMLSIFVKDLDIVHAEARRLQSHIPLASAALQQFRSGISLGLGQKDDSQVVQVYEKVTGKKVQISAGAVADTDAKEGNDIGDVWVMEDGTKEEIFEVGSEPRHQVVLHNEYVRALRVSFPPNDTTLAHRHSEDSIYFFLVEVQGGGMLNVVNHVKGDAPACDCMEFGEVRYGTHKTDKPLVHKITNKTNQIMLCIDAEVLKQPPVTAAIPLFADKHELIKTRDKCRIYKLTLEPGESVTVSYPFFHCTVVLRPGTVEKETGGCIRWTETSELGDVAWKEPVAELKKTNIGSHAFVEFIAEWR